MAIAATTNLTSYFGDQKVVIGTIAFDSSYPTNGEAYTAATFGLKTLSGLFVFPYGGLTFEPIVSALKIKARWVDTSTDGAVLAEVVNTTDISAADLVPFIAFGS